MQQSGTSFGGLTAPRPLALVGAGALGSAIAQLLMRAAYRSVLLIDRDRVEPHNITVGGLFGPGSAGQYKVEVLSGLARGQGLPWEVRCLEIADVGLGVLREAAVLVSATDSVLSRLETAFAARSLGVPMLDAGVQPRGIAEGRVSWFAPAAGAACALCGLGEVRRAELLGLALSASLGCQVPEADEPMTGAPSTVERTAQRLVATLAEWPAEDASFALKLDGEKTERIGLTRSPSCPWHELPTAADGLFALEDDRPVSEQIDADAVLELGWPTCLRARCRQCGAMCEPRRRNALVRRVLRCPGCGARGALEPQHTLSSLAAASPLARETPRALGLPERHLYHRRQRHAMERGGSRA